MTRKRIAAGLILFAYLVQMVVVPIALSNPTGLTTSTPGVTFSGVGTSNVTISSTALSSIVNAQGFNISHTETTSVLQAANAAMLVRIGDLNPTSINGHLNATGQLILLNPNGIIFGPNAQVNVGALIASTLNLTNANFLAGHYLFQGAGIEGPVKNLGAIHGTQDGVYLLAPNIENSGIITSPKGNIVLAAGATAFLSHRPDGRGLLAELSNPLGQAVNLKDLIADGGNITLAGRVVNQAGMIRADSVHEQNGKIELLASEAVTLQDGSRTLARGGDDGVSSGGTVRVIADLTNGTATFQKGAVVDVSGGKSGGDGGFAEVSGASVKLGGQFLGRTLAGFHGGRFLIDPIVSSVGPADFASFEGSGASSVTFQSPAGSDLVVTGKYDLNAGWSLSGTPGTLTFLAGANLIFNNARLTNNNSNTKWDYIGTATTGDVLINNSVISSGFGGNISLTAASGNIRLVDALGNLSIVKTSAVGGDITLTAGLDVVSPSAEARDKSAIGSSKFFGGIRLDGPGNLTINAGNDFRGDVVQTNSGTALTGPGFVLTNGTANVTAGRNIGGPTRGDDSTAPDEYANITLSKGTINLTAENGSIYLGRVQDKGVTDSTSTRTLTVDPSNSVVLKAMQDIFLNPLALSTTNEAVARVSVIYPASFSATTTTGSIFVQNDLKLWPSTTGAVTLSAGKDLVGVQRPEVVRDFDWDYIFIGFKNVLGGHWELVNIPMALKDPQLAPFVRNTSPNALSFNGIAKPVSGFPTKTVMTTAPTITLLEQDPSLYNNKPLNTNVFLANIDLRTTNVIPPHAVQDVVMEARSGDIKTLVFNLQSVPFQKRVTIRAANDIEAVTAKVGVPNGVVATVEAGHNLNMRTAGSTGASAVSDLTFNGTGTGRVIVGNLMDLAASTGINFQNLPDPTTDINKGGFLDISVGGSIKMDSSRIATYNGAAISIHGLGTNSILDAGNVRVENGKPVAVVGTIVQENGHSVIQVNGTTLEFKNNTVILDGAQPLPDTVNPVTIHLSFVEQGGKLLTTMDGKPFQVVRAEVPLNAAKTLTGFDPVLVSKDGHNQLVLVAGDGTVMLVPVDQQNFLVAQVQSLPGAVTVGSNVASNPDLRGAPLGITTLGGGGIDVYAKGNIDVEKSRISTFYGGDINLTSTAGNINAGSGSRNESVTQIITQTIGGKEVFLTIKVPASGISTFHPDDPRPLKFIEFNDPEIAALKNQAARESFFGRQALAATLLAKANELQAQRQPIFNETVLKPYINSLKLGDVNLVAERGSVVIPSAGIQGRNVHIIAPTVDNQGGAIIGNIAIAATVNLTGPPLSITGTGSGAVSTPLTPVTGSTASASVSSTTAAVSTSSKSSDSVQEAASETASQKAQPKQVASNKDNEKDRKSQIATSVRMKRGVVIQVDVKPEVKPEVKPAS